MKNNKIWKTALTCGEKIKDISHKAILIFVISFVMPVMAKAQGDTLPNTTKWKVPEMSFCNIEKNEKVIWSKAISNEKIINLFAQIQNGYFSIEIGGKKYESNTMTPIKIISDTYRDITIDKNWNKNVKFFTDAEDFFVTYDSDQVAVAVNWTTKSGEKIIVPLVNMKKWDKIEQENKLHHHTFKWIDRNTGASIISTVDISSWKKFFSCMIIPVRWNYVLSTQLKVDDKWDNLLVDYRLPKRELGKKREKLYLRTPTESCTHEMAVYYDITYTNLVGQGNEVTSIENIISLASVNVDDEFDECSIQPVLQVTSHADANWNELFVIDYSNSSTTLTNFKTRAWDNDWFWSFYVTWTMFSGQSFDDADGRAYTKW